MAKLKPVILYTFNPESWGKYDFSAFSQEELEDLLLENFCNTAVYDSLEISLEEFLDFQVEEGILSLKEE